MISRIVDAEESIRGVPPARHTEIELRHPAVELNQDDPGRSRSRRAGHIRVRCD